MAWFSVMTSWVTRAIRLSPRRVASPLGENQQLPAEPTALGARMHGDVLDEQMVLAGVQGEHGRDRGTGDPGGAVLDGRPIVAQHRGGRLVHPREVFRVGGVDECLDGRGRSAALA